ncbi:hypothetical protein P4053_34100, partial [Pseudomonas aeruginosa]|nr:hypothetical protein [Pseudomonas aeruginosa]
MLDDLYAIDQGAVLPDLEQILVVLGQHSDLIPHLMAVAADVDEEWVKVLPHRDGNFLLYVWWLVNGPFFIGAVVDRIPTERAAEEARKAVGRTSMLASSPGDTGPSGTIGRMTERQILLLYDAEGGGDCPTTGLTSSSTPTWRLPADRTLKNTSRRFGLSSGRF